MVADDDASTKAVRMSPSVKRGDSSPLSAVPSPTDMGEEDTTPIPTIRISTESAREESLKAEKEAAAAKLNGVENGSGEPAVEGLQQPAQAAASGDGDGDSKDATPMNGSGGQESFSFSNKRLCERWLDNLFMVLYEDLRVWTIFRAEVAHFKTQHVAYRKSGHEWEIIGDLGLRLHHKEEAKEAFQRALDAPRYSVKPWSKLLEVYADEGDLMRTLQVAIRVAAYQYGEYAELAYPTQIARLVFKLEPVHGHAKIWNTLLSMGLPEPILHVMQRYLQYGQRFKIEGSDF